MNQDISTNIADNFRLHLAQLGYSKSTVAMLPRCVSSFLEYANTSDVSTLEKEQIEGFYDHLHTRLHKKKGTLLSETFIHHHIYALNLFFNWLEQSGAINQNPMSNLKFKKSEARHQREPLTQVDIRQLFESTQNAKEIAILHLFYSCGLRRTEAENLDTNDIHFTQKLLYVRLGKGAKRRAIPMPQEVKKDLEKYFKQCRKTQPAKDPEAFVLNTKMTRMKGNQYHKILKNILQRTTLETTITLHHLRHSIATHLLENGLRVEYVRDFLGHRHLDTTQLYAKVFNNQLKKI